MDIVPFIKGIFPTEEEEHLGFSRGDIYYLAFELMLLRACQLQPQNACLKQEIAYSKLTGAS
jgi:hypothetical protein